VSAATRAAMPPGGLPNPKGFPDLRELALGFLPTL